MKVKLRLLALAFMSLGALGLAVMLAGRGEPMLSSNVAPSTPPAARDTQSSRPKVNPTPGDHHTRAPSERPLHGAVEATQDERAEVSLTEDWDAMSPKQRADTARGQFRSSLEIARESGSQPDLEHAATILSILRAELYTTDAGRQEFDRLEAEYDVVELTIGPSQ